MKLRETWYNAYHLLRYVLDVANYAYDAYVVAVVDGRRRNCCSAEKGSVSALCVDMAWALSGT